MSGHQHDDEIRRLLIDRRKLRETAAAAEKTPQFAAMQTATVAFQECAESRASEAADQALVEAEEKMITDIGVSLYDLCESCGCPLFTGDKLNEQWRGGDDDVVLCEAAAHDSEQKDCPGKRLGLS